jgi:hypothetical protein
MKRVAYLSLYWHPQSPEIGAETRRYVEELIGRYKLKVREFRTDRNSCYFSPLDADSKRFRDLMAEIEKRSDIDDVGLKVWPSYTQRELESSPLLLWFFTNQAIEDDYYTLHFKTGQARGIAPYTRNCEVCRAPLEQVRDIWVDVRKMGKRDLSMTYTFEVILSVHLAQTLQESGLTGFTLRPVWDYRRPQQGEPRLFQFVVTHVLPPMASPPTEFEREQRCGVCGTESRYIKHTHYWGRIQYYEETDIYYAKDVLKTAADFNRTAERFGDLPVSKPYVLISQRAYQWLRGQGVKGWTVEPVYLVE